ARPRPTPAPAPPRRDPTTLASAVAQLDAAVERDEVGRTLLAYLRQLFDRVALFAVRRDGVHGWMGAGDGLDRERLADVAIPFDRPSIFLNLRQGSPLHIGPLPPMPAHRPLVAALGVDPPGPCVCLPVRLGERLAAVIYGDRDGAPVAALDLDALRHLADRAAAALERCISLKRQAHSGPAAG
ncbi:MAG TPA: GAF domain-containing protein, partial [Thermoanaerobaculia bacterium]|nr:GAF domain-containing protein [Thermoanaerobaculia bacterium]